MAKHRYDTRPRRGRGAIVRVGPTLKELERLCKSVQGDVEDESRATDDPDDDISAILLTVGADDQGGWSYQTGDTSFNGGAYGFPYWGQAEISRDLDSKEAAQRIKEELMEAYWSDR